MSADYPTICEQCSCLKNNHITGGVTSVHLSLIHTCISQGTDEYLLQTHRANRCNTVLHTRTTLSRRHKEGRAHINCILIESFEVNAYTRHPSSKPVGPLYLTSNYSRSTASLFQKSALLIIHMAPSIFQS